MSTLLATLALAPMLASASSYAAAPDMPIYRYVYNPIAYQSTLYFSIDELQRDLALTIADENKRRGLEFLEHHSLQLRQRFAEPIIAAR